MPEIFCIIMAGGSGERFWPRSRKHTPKQLLNLLGEVSLIEQTILRLQGFVPYDRILIVTNQLYVEKIRTICPQIPKENILGEPMARDTAPCIAFAAGIVKAKAATSNPAMIFLPSDHWIVNREAMISDFAICSEKAVETNALITIGIPPSGPSPDYGYIECGVQKGTSRLFHVNRFLEKPSAAKAEQLLAQGNYRWNSGMFIFPLKGLKQELEKQAPDLCFLSNRIAEVWGTELFNTVLKEEFEKIRKISIDYAVMEHASDIMMLEASFDWDDIGNWPALKNHFQLDENNNVQNASSCLLDCKDCIVFTDDSTQLLAGIDLNGLMLIKTKDALLVAPAKSASKIKVLLATLSAQERFQKYL
ncbi:MAG: mannose-1-phosphate guanylyltransferase [Victivallales bacterium]|jgi:mannose-1-phosphate guanylyltransferase